MKTLPSTIPPARLILVAVVVLLFSFLPLLVSWRWDWIEAWVYAALNLVSFAVGRLFLAIHTPDLVAERARFTSQEGAKPWDRILAPLVVLGSSIISLVAGLEVRIGGLPAMNLPVEALALAIMLAGFGIGNYALLENRFFSGVVRIQKDRGQTVVTTGPYRWVRHPGYAGSLLVFFAIPVFLGSLWAFLPAVIVAIALVLRTSLEDEVLQDELEGYREYARKVRYRLVPGIW